MTILSVCVLFVQVWSPLSDDVNFSAQEKSGIEYLTALTKLSSTLADAETSAVAGDTVSGGDLSGAVDAVTAVNTKVGAKLGAQARWSGLRTKIEALPNRDVSDSSAVYLSYTQVTDLLLALYDEVRDKSNLSRDPDSVSFFLQDAASEQLPLVIIRAGRYNDLAVLAEKLPSGTATANATADEAAATTNAATAKSKANAAVVTARAQVAESAAAVVDDLTDAVDSSSSSTFGTDILQQLDSFKRAADVLAPSTPGLAAGAIPYSVELGKSRDEVESSAADLDTTIYSELKTTIDDRQSDDQRSRVLAVLSFIVALALIIAVHVIAWVRRRPRGKGDRKTAPAAFNPSSVPPPNNPDERNGALVPGYGDNGSSRREWSGAPR